MAHLHALLAAHPLRKKKPYNAIKFAGVDGFGTPLYRVARSPQTMGAASALRAAFERLGGHCFHCGIWMAAEPFSRRCTLDHLRPRKKGGRDDLHNLVFACRPCNQSKGGTDLISFNAQAGAEYISALEEHLTQCVRALRHLRPVAAASSPELRGTAALIRGHPNSGT